MNGKDRRPRPLMVDALSRVDFRYPLSRDDAELLYNSTAEERQMVAAHHARVANLYLRQAWALHYAAVMLRRWWDRPGVTLRGALAAAPPELSETVRNRLREVGFTVD